VAGKPLSIHRQPDVHRSFSRAKFKSSDLARSFSPGFIVPRRRISLALSALACLLLTGASGAQAATADSTRLAQAQPGQLPEQTPPQAPATALPAGDAASAAADEPVGNVATLTGIATVIRKKNSISLKLRDDIFLNDVVQTSANSTLGITFNDATTFNLSANAKIAIDNYLYEDGGKQNSAIFDIGKGTVAFVAAAVAKSGDMKITTPTASLGIRGTTGVVEVPEGAAANTANNVNIKLYPDADGRIGRIEVNDRAGVRLGFLTQAASGFAIRPGTGGARFAAVPLTITPQQAQRDQGFVRRVQAAQTVGRRIISEQRAYRRANPGLNNHNNQPQRPPQPGQPQPQRQNGAPGPNRPGQQQPGAPHRQGTKQGTQPGQRQGTAPQPAVPPQQGGSQHAPSLQQRVPGLQRPAPLNRPAPRKPVAPPKGKRERR
jgi:hypothetical protein